MSTHKEQHVRTADGREIPFSEVTHQHWSNIYHYNKIFLKKTEEKRLKEVEQSKKDKDMTSILYVELLYESYNEKINGFIEQAQEQINERFEGVILPYKPKYAFEEKDGMPDVPARRILVEKAKRI